MPSAGGRPLRRCGLGHVATALLLYKAGARDARPEKGGLVVCSHRRAPTVQAQQSQRSGAGSQSKERPFWAQAQMGYPGPGHGASLPKIFTTALTGCVALIFSLSTFRFGTLLSAPYRWVPGVTVMYKDDDGRCEAHYNASLLR
ncbi:hypothetical protein FA95DRAFT_1567200 [Auriscalpium vulgare]|uniref:Uncharacterized protein n=1 Tax=Auriscalpium vulgare TaxID=40419 RepID=A0ACB8R5T2_9AGAM|nr:hypothetical protein FA95DRAFT_1567200 [Auriscalpium vulgare]